MVSNASAHVVATIAGIKNKLAINTLKINTVISPIKNAIGENTDASIRKGLPKYGIFPSSATVIGIISSRRTRKGKDTKDPITVCHLLLMNFIESPTEKKISPRICSRVILDAIVLTRKNMEAKTKIPNHIAPVVSGFNSVAIKGGTGKNP